jgi:hypothetical protein
MRKLGAIAVVGVVWGAITLSPAAQSGLTITAPASGARLAAGPDYATDVLGDPWDMSNPEDVSPYPTPAKSGWASDFAVSGGRVGGTTALNNGSRDSSVAFLYRGFYDVVNTGRTGRRYPIDSSFYKVVSFKLYSGVAGEAPQAFWFHYPWGGPNGGQYGIRFLPSTVAGNQIYVADLTQSLAAGQPWTQLSTVRGFRLDPNGTKVGHTAYFDWVRLTRSDTQTTAKTRIQWSGGSGGTNIDIIDSGGTSFRAATNVSGSFYDWNHGVMPPGNYTLRVIRGSSTATRTFSINNPPLVKVIDPDETGGQDYATQVLANPWDMDSSATDVRSTSNVSGTSYSGSQFHGTNTNGDPLVMLLNGSNNSTPINTDKYRYLTYSLKVDGPFDLDATNGGSVARINWSSSTASAANASNTTTTEDIIVFSGMNSYTIDLGTLQLGEDKGLESLGSMQSWTAADVRHFRIDPHEFKVARQFHFDNVKLAAMDEAFGSFTIRFSGSDADGNPSTVSLYYDTNTNPNDGRTLITSGVSLGAGSYTWNTGNVTPGTYWIYALVTDGVDQRGAYSTGQIRVNAGGSTVGDPITVIESPSSVSVTPPFTLTGWAIDRDATSGSGVDYVQVYARNGGGSDTLLGNATRTTRNDIAQIYGSQFAQAGYTMSIGSLSPGNYTLRVRAHSSVTNSFNERTTNVTVQAGSTAVSNVQMAIEAPANGSSTAGTFTVRGWAVDIGSPTGTGVDMVNVYYMPATGGTATNLGLATYGIAKSNVGAQYGSRFTNSGFQKSITVPSGRWTIVVYARSTVNGKWKVKTSTVTVGSGMTVAQSDVRVSISSPAPNAHLGRTFTISGSAFDLGAPNGTGVDAVAIYRMPASGGSATLIGLATYGSAQSSVGSQYGNQFRNSGYSRSVTLSPGQYKMVAFAHSTVTNLWTSKTVTVTVH